MPALDQLAFRLSDTGSSHAPAANTQAQVTLAAKKGYCWIVTGYSMSTGGNLAAGVTGSVIAGAQTLDKFYAPSGAPVNQAMEFGRGFRCPENTAVVATLPAGGSGISGVVTLRAFELQV